MFVISNNKHYETTNKTKMNGRIKVCYYNYKAHLTLTIRNIENKRCVGLYLFSYTLFTAYGICNF